MMVSAFFMYKYGYWPWVGGEGEDEQREATLSFVRRRGTTAFVEQGREGVVEVELGFCSCHWRQLLKTEKKEEEKNDACQVIVNAMDSFWLSGNFPFVFMVSWTIYTWQHGKRPQLEHGHGLALRCRWNPEAWQEVQKIRSGKSQNIDFVWSLADCWPEFAALGLLAQGQKELILTPCNISFVFQTIFKMLAFNVGTM